MSDTNSQAKYIVDENGQKAAVVLPIEEYEELLAGPHDLAIIAECRDETTLSFEDIKERLKKKRTSYSDFPS